MEDHPVAMSYGVIPPKASILDGSAFKDDDAADEEGEKQSLLGQVRARRHPYQT